MPTCPVCGLECDCNGDWDDAQVMTEEWAMENCVCDHEGSGLDEDELFRDDSDDSLEWEGA